jgi:hypothetical protein
MEVLKVKIDFENPGSCSIPEKTTAEDLGHLKDLEISKYKRLFSLERP